MSAGIVLVAFDDFSINDANYQTEVDREDELASSFFSEPVEAEVAESFPVSVGVQPNGLDFRLTVTLVNTTAITLAHFEAIDRVFDPSPHLGERYLTADDTNDVRRRILCRPLHLQRISNNQIQIAMRASVGLWESEEESYSSQSLTAAATHIATTNPGSARGSMRIALTPTAQMDHANALIHRRRLIIANRVEQAALDDPTGEGYAIDVATSYGVAAFDHAALTTAKSLASGDDVFVLDHGVYIPRWMTNHDTSAAKVWAHQRLSPARRVTLASAFTSTVPAAGSTFEVSNPEGTALLGLDEFLVIDDVVSAAYEVIHVLRFSATELMVLQRGALGTTAAAHDAGKTCWRVENPYLNLLYDWTAAPVYQELLYSDVRPLLNVNDSTNVKHVWTESFLVPAGTRRSMGWLPEKTDDGPTSGYIRLYERSIAAQFTIANSEYLSAADSAGLSTGNIDFSLSGWFYLDAIDTAASQMVISKWSETGDQREWIAFYYPVDDLFYFEVSSSGAVGGVVAVSAAPPGDTQIRAGRWYFFAVWHDATANTINLQINNGPVTSGAHAGGVFDSTAPLRIGAYETGGAPTGFLGGRVQMVTYHKRVYSAFERAWLYNEGKGRRFEETYWTSPTGFRANLVDIWPLNEQSGTRAGVAGNNLTDNGTVTNAEGIVPGSELVFEDALPVAGKPNYNNAFRDFPVPIAPLSAAVELDYTVENNMLLHGLITDIDGLESRLITRGPTTVLTNQQFAPAKATQRLRLNGRIGCVIGNKPSLGSLLAFALETGVTSGGMRFVLDQETSITALELALNESSASADDIRVEIYEDSSDAPGTPLVRSAALSGPIPIVANASLGSALAAFLLTLSTPALLPAGTYWIVIYKAASTGGTLNFGYSPMKIAARQYFRGSAATNHSVVPYGRILTLTTGAQADAALETGDKVTIDNLDPTLQTERAPLVFPAGEEDFYHYATRIRNVRNLVTNSGFESNTTGHALSGSNTIARSTEQAHYDPARGFFGKASLKCTYQNNTTLDTYAITLPHASQNYTGTLWVFIPTNWDGGAISLDFTGFTSSTPGTSVTLAATETGRWVRIRLTELMDSDVAGSLTVVTASAPTAGRSIYIDDMQIEPGEHAYAGGFFATDGDYGGEYIDISFASALNQRLEIDLARRLVIDRELNLPVPFAVKGSSPEQWPAPCPGLNSWRVEEPGLDGATGAMTAEIWHRGAWV